MEIEFVLLGGRHTHKGEVGREVLKAMHEPEDSKKEGPEASQDVEGFGRNRNDCIGSLSPQRWDGSWCEHSPGRGDGCVGAVGMGTTEARSQTMSCLQVGARVSCGGGRR